MAEQSELDIAAILETLRAEVRAQRASQGSGEAGTALSAIERELQHSLEQLEITRVVSAHWPLEGKSLYERGWAAVHKVVRRALKWYIPPIVEQQNAFNDTAARSLRLLIEAHAELRDQLAELRRQIEQAPPPSDAASAESGGPPDDGAAPTTAELQRLVERGGRAEPPAPLPDLGLRLIVRTLDEVSVVSAHSELGGTSLFTRGRAFMQRAMRQYLRWMINPIVEQQNAYNQALAAAAPHLIAADGELRARVAQARAQVRGSAEHGAAWRRDRLSP